MNHLYIDGTKPPLRSPIWKFTADGDGGGFWVSKNLSSTAAGYTRPYYGFFTSSYKAGFYIGGIGNNETDQRQQRESSIPWIVTFDYKTRLWTNTSINDAFSLGSGFGGTAIFADEFGDSGMLLALGGVDYGIDTPVYSGYIGRSFENVTIYDPTTKQWLWQTTSGDAPVPREGHCRVGVAGQSGTYEM